MRPGIILMKIRNAISVVLTRLKYNLWIRPSLIVLGFTGFAFGLVEFSRHFDPKTFSFWPSLFQGGPDSARLILSTIATSIMTITGVAFSVTIVALTLASSQYSSRILGKFLKDRVTQRALGFLSGVFAYCLVVLLHVGKGSAEEPFVPTLAVLFSMVVGLMAIGVFMYFIHHIASTIRATNIVTDVRTETLKVIEKLWPKEMKRDEFPEEKGLVFRAVPSPRAGYITDVEQEKLIEFATKHDLVVKIEKAVGDFVVEGDLLVSYSGRSEKDLDSQLTDFCSLDRQRTLEKDPLFGIRQIVDVALKALSPGINDVTTAVISIHQLLVILHLALERSCHKQLFDDGKTIRLIRKAISFRCMLEEAFNEIAYNGKSHNRILLELIDATGGLLQRAPTKEFKHILREEAAFLKEVLLNCPLPESSRSALMREWDLRFAPE